MKRTTSISLLIVLITLLVATPVYSQSSSDGKDTQQFRDSETVSNFLELTPKRIIAVSSSADELYYSVSTHNCPDLLSQSAVEEAVKQEFFRYRIKPIPFKFNRLVLVAVVECLVTESQIIHMTDVTFRLPGNVDVSVGRAEGSYGISGENNIIKVIPSLKKYVERKLILFVEAHMENP